MRRKLFRTVLLFLGLSSNSITRSVLTDRLRRTISAAILGWYFPGDNPRYLPGDTAREQYFPGLLERWESRPRSARGSRPRPERRPGDLLLPLPSLTALIDVKKSWVQFTFWTSFRLASAILESSFLLVLLLRRLLRPSRRLLRRVEEESPVFSLSSSSRDLLLLLIMVMLEVSVGTDSAVHVTAVKAVLLGSIDQ